MDLIDLRAFREDYALGKRCEDCKRYGKKDCDYPCYSARDFCGWLDDAPTISAVPLEPLCEWLAGYKVPPPEYALEAVGAYDPIDPNSVVHTPNQVRDAWKYAIQNMMECGLLKEDEDG